MEKPRVLVEKKTKRKRGDYRGQFALFSWCFCFMNKTGRRLSPTRFIKKKKKKRCGCFGLLMSLWDKGVSADSWNYGYTKGLFRLVSGWVKKKRETLKKGMRWPSFGALRVIKYSTELQLRIHSLHLLLLLIPPTDILFSCFYKADDWYSLCPERVTLILAWFTQILFTSSSDWAVSISQFSLVASLHLLELVSLCSYKKLYLGF